MTVQRNEITAILNRPTSQELPVPRTNPRLH
jgi:hypothetical protein